MLLTKLAGLAIVVGTARFVSATVALGVISYNEDNGPFFNVAWIEGEDACSTFALINVQGPNPCGKHFTLDNGFTYQEAYCGTTSYALLNADGSYNHACDGVKDQRIPCFDLGAVAIDKHYVC